MGQDTKVEYLIVDTSAFIRNAQLQEIGHNIITEENVVNEIKNKRQLKRLVVLPYDLKVQQAFPEDVKIVTEFAKKTGDYTSLSATDIKVIALTYRLEREKIGTEHLRTTPEIVKTIKDISEEPHDLPKTLVGFYNPTVEENYQELEDSNDKQHGNIEQKDKENSDTEVIKQLVNDIKTSLENDNSETESVKSESQNSTDTKTDYETAPSDNEYNDVDDMAKKFSKLECEPSDFIIDCNSEHNIDDILVPLKDDTIEENCSEEEDEIEDDDDEGWITPKNIVRAKKQVDSDVVTDKPATVACLTMDFAMQNVLIQMGLNVASLDGRIIKQKRTFILRCYACFKTTSVMTKIFCPHCGHKTLKKVAVSVNEDGTLQMYINYKKKLSARGKRFSLPTPKGGKHANNPILREDQPVPQQRPSRLARIKNDPLNEDYISGYSPFVMRDVNSRSAMLGIRPGTEMKYWMRKNPNESRRHKK